MEFLLILILLILSIVAMNRSSRAERLARTLEQDLKRLRQVVATLQQAIDALKGGRPSAQSQEESIEKQEIKLDAWARPVQNTMTTQQEPVPKDRGKIAVDRPAVNKPPFEIPKTPVEPTAFDRFFAKLKSYFTGSQLFVSIGVILLTFSAGFLIKLGIDYGVFPIELRVAAVGLIGAILLIVGWRLREKSRAYALILQGGGVGLMYMTTFAAARFFDLIPLPAALLLMIALGSLSGALAVVQDAKSMAFFGAAGGFLAPILTSTGKGNHVMLFSYYALLNTGIVGIAWFKAWRELNLLGYAFTFIIGTLWGITSYRPELYASTQPFLIVFVVFYVAIAILFSTRQPPLLKGYVDGTLVFGVPIVAFALQAGLVHEIEYGLAFSAVAAGAFYLTMATILWKRGQKNFKLLTEAFLSLGVVFGTVSIPLAFDGMWIASAWVMEGAALIWIGVRQGRLTARIFGMLLQLGSGLALFSGPLHSPEELPVLNGAFLGTVLIAASGLFTQFYLHRNHDRLHATEPVMGVILFVWGNLWWYIGGLGEIALHAEYPFSSFLLFFSASSVILMLLDSRLTWSLLRIPLFATLPLQALFLVVKSVESHAFHPFADMGFIVWFVVLAVEYRQLFVYRSIVNRYVLEWHHALALWMLIFILTREASWAMMTWTDAMGETWRSILWGVIPSAFVLSLVRFGSRLRWPVVENYKTYLSFATVPVLIWIGLWFIVHALLDRGRVSPLPYVPLFNPLDMALAFAVLVGVFWYKHLDQIPGLTLPALSRQPLLFILSTGCFLWLNGIIARTIHHYLGYDYSFRALWNSSEFQTTISITWTLLALGLMIIAKRTIHRTLWLGGAGLLAIVVVKLFFVELEKTGAIARVVSFMVVGALMLVIGYLVPLPPKPPEKTS